MRMRIKKHGAERLAACGNLLLDRPAVPFASSRDVIGEDLPLWLEIGCGKGDFACGMAEKYPDVCFVALERISNVMVNAVEKAAARAENRPDRLRFAIADAASLSEWFAPHSLDRIFLNFSDPWPKKGYFKRRLTSPAYLERYGTLLEPGGELFFKTDNEPLFDWSLEQFGAAGLETLYVTRDLHSSDLCAGNIETEHERRFAADGKPIFAAGVRFPAKTETGSEAADGDR